MLSPQHITRSAYRGGGMRENYRDREDVVNEGVMKSMRGKKKVTMIPV
jgi:hypothetical protein